MSDHWHYANDIHGGAEQHHRHYDLERDIEHVKNHEHPAPVPVLPELDRECRTCQGTTEVCTPQWVAWSERENAAEAEWDANPANAGKHWRASAESVAIWDDEPAQDRMNCPACQVSGYELTDAGREVLRFLQRHPPALTRT